MPDFPESDLNGQAGLNDPDPHCEFCGHAIPSDEFVKAQFVCDDGITERICHMKCFQDYVAQIKGVVMWQK